jgi:transcriptional regulator with XRE-family HTH domain
MADYKDILNDRRKRLGMTCKTLAAQSGVSWATVQRALSGGKNISFENFIAIANALGCTLTIRPDLTEEQLIQRQARAKAEVLSGLTQGTSAIEAQAVPEKTVSQARRQLIHHLMSGSRRRLWT